MRLGRVPMLLVLLGSCWALTSCVKPKSEKAADARAIADDAQARCQEAKGNADLAHAVTADDRKGDLKGIDDQVRVICRIADSMSNSATAAEVDASKN